MKKIVLAALCSTALISVASAADLAPGAAPAYVKAQAAAPATNWSGFYAGLNVGYGFGAGGSSHGQQDYYNNGDHVSSPDQWYGPGGPSWSNSSNMSGVVGGAQAGFNYQIAPAWVIGVETDIQGSGLKASGSATDSTTMQLFPAGSPQYNWPVTGTASVSQGVNWYGTLRGRVGFTIDDNALLIYGTGGLAYGEVHQSLNYSGAFTNSPVFAGWGAGEGPTPITFGGSGSSSQVNVGWTAGAGFEYRPAEWQNWSIKTEYLYTDLGSSTISVTGPGFRSAPGTDTHQRTVQVSNTADFQFQTVKVGLNYHFN